MALSEFKTEAVDLEDVEIKIEPDQDLLSYEDVCNGDETFSNITVKHELDSDHNQSQVQQDSHNGTTNSQNNFMNEFVNYVNQLEKVKEATCRIKLPCSKCGKIVKFGKEQVDTLSENQTLLCSSCCTDVSSDSGVTSSGSSLKNEFHYKVVLIHGIRKWSCIDCGKVYKNKASLKSHMLVHFPDTPFVCSECGKTFKQRSYLKQHMEIHLRVEPTICSECGQSFRCKYTYYQHMLNNHKIQLYTCSACGEYIDKRKLDTNGDKRQHTICNTCQDRLTRKDFTC